MSVWVSSDGLDEFMPLLLISRTIEARISRRMDFVHNNQIWAVFQKLVLAPVALGEVERFVEYFERAAIRHIAQHLCIDENVAPEWQGTSLGCYF